MKPYDHKMILDNGLEVYLKNTSTRTVYSYLEVGFGGAHHPKDGLAHLLEHMMCHSGSQNYTSTQMEFMNDSLGAYNAETGSYETDFYADLLPSHLAKYYAHLSDILFYPDFDEKTFREQKDIIKQEINEYKSSEHNMDVLSFKKKLFGNNSIYAHNAIGDVQVVDELRIDELLSAHREHFVGKNMRLYVSGNLPLNTQELIWLYFSQAKVGSDKRINLPVPKNLHSTQLIQKTYASEFINRDDKDNSTALFEINMSACKKFHDDHSKLDILGSLLCSGTNSRIFKLLRSQGYSYRVGGGFYPKEKFGQIAVTAFVNSLKQDEALDAVFRDIGEFKNSRVVEQNQLNLVKGKLLYNMEKLYETNEGMVGAMKVYVDYNVLVSDYLNQIRDISSSDILDVANKYLVSNREQGNYGLLIRDPLLKEK